MESVNKKLVRNFLSHKVSSKALLWSLVTLGLCLLMSQLYWNYPIGEYLNAYPEAVFARQEYWRLFTSSWIHGDLAHFLSNSFMLIIMGYFVNYHYGTVMFPVTAFLAGVMINGVVIWDYPETTSLVGASGVVHYLWGFWLVLFMCIQRHMPFTERFLKATAVGIFILAPTEFKPQVSYYAHGVGLVLGMLVGCGYFLWNRRKIQSFEEWEIVPEVVDEELALEAMSFERQ